MELLVHELDILFLGYRNKDYTEGICKYIWGVILESDLVTQQLNLIVLVDCVSILLNYSTTDAGDLVLMLIQILKTGVFLTQHAMHKFSVNHFTFFKKSASFAIKQFMFEPLN
jgi:hypothetical protein